MVAYEKQTVKELRQKAKDRGLVNYSNLRKDDLIKLLRSKKSSSKKNLKESVILKRQRTLVDPKTGIIKSKRN